MFYTERKYRQAVKDKRKDVSSTHLLQRQVCLVLVVAAVFGPVLGVSFCFWSCCFWDCLFSLHYASFGHSCTSFGHPCSGCWSFGDCASFLLGGRCVRCFHPLHLPVTGGGVLFWCYYYYYYYYCCCVLWVEVFNFLLGTPRLCASRFCKTNSMVCVSLPPPTSTSHGTSVYLVLH